MFQAVLGLLYFWNKSMKDYSIQSGHWEEIKQDSQSIREQVFIQEQKINPADEWDSEDQMSLHFVVYACQPDVEYPIATARLLKNNSIGRVAVLKAYRGKGIGRFIMLNIIEHAKLEQRPFLKLSAQVHAIQFYQSLGFQVFGDEYLDCAIPHRDMMQSLE